MAFLNFTYKFGIKLDALMIFIDKDIDLLIFIDVRFLSGQDLV